MKHLAVLLGLAALAAAGPEQTHTGTFKTSHFTVHVRPGSRAAASVERTAAMAERDLARIHEQMGLPVAGRYRLFLYDSLPELHAITKTAGNAGFSAGDASHVPFDNDQTRFHELVHIVAYTWPKSGPEVRNLFFAEGLANALLEYVHGVPVHAVASFYRKRKQLPALAKMTDARDFYAFMSAHPGFNAYDVAASWIRFLLDEHGAKKVRAYYTGTSAKKAFGKSAKALEAAWHKLLAGFELRPEVELLLRRRAGEEVRFDRWGKPWTRLPAELRGKEKDWRALPDATVASKDANWSLRALGRKKIKNGALAARVRPSKGCLGVQLQFGARVQAMLVQNGLFLYDRGRAVHHTPAERLGAADVHLVLVRRDGTMEIWVDGVRALHGPVDDEAALPGIGVALGSAVFTEVKWRAFK